LQRIGQSALKMSSIVDELLLLASVRKMEDVKTGPLDMAAVVAQAQGRLYEMAASLQAEFVVPGASAWPRVLGYGPWIEEVWVNYISNALKYGGRPRASNWDFRLRIAGLGHPPLSLLVQVSRIANLKFSFGCATMGQG